MPYGSLEITTRQLHDNEQNSLQRRWSFKDITCTTNDGQCHVAVSNLKNEYAIMYIKPEF